MKRHHSDIENTEPKLPDIPQNIDEVTKENFDVAFEKIKELLANCDFIALDEEMTGISLPESAYSFDDTPQIRYAKMRHVVHTFSSWQYGLCLFHRVEGSSTYVASPFTIWAAPLAWRDYDPIVSFSASALEFKRNNHVDLNKWLYHSVNYVNKPMEEKLHAQFFPPPQTPETPPTERKSAEFKETELEIIQEIMSEIQFWLGKDQEEFEIDETKFTSRGIRINSYFRRNLLDFIEKKHSQVVTEVRPVPGQQPWVVRTFVLNLTEEQKKRREELKEIEKRKIFESKIGVRRLFSLLVSQPRPLIVHNGLYDLMFLLHHLDTPLPDTLEAFNNLAHTYFPQVFDTKFLFSCTPLVNYMGETNLEELYNQICKKQNKVVPLEEGFDRYRRGTFLHEAGYDAYLTGSIFATLSPNLELKKQANKLFLMKSIYIWNLEGECETLGKAFHCSFPKNLVTSDLEKLVVNIPGQMKIIWINDTSAFLVYDNSAAIESEGLLKVLYEGGITAKEVI